MVRALVFVMVASACADEPAAPDVSILAQEPRVLSLGVDGADDVSLRLGYHDGDGDIGGGVADVYDCRAADAGIQLPIPAVASPEIVEEHQAIDGELILLIPDVDALDPDPAAPPPCAALGVGAPAAGEMVLCVELTDSGGHRGKGDCSAPFTLE